MSYILQKEKAAFASDLNPKTVTSYQNQYSHKTTESQFDRREISSHVNGVIQACQADQQGNSVIAFYGQNPHTGLPLRSQVSNFKLDRTSQITEYIINHSSEEHLNAYMPLCLMRSDLPMGKKGGEKDIVVVFGLVADFDDANAHNWNSRIPCDPSFVLETSPGRFQVGFLFDKPLSPSEAKPLAIALKKYCNCDHGTADLSHVWRIPGTLNWPNKTKLNAGRSPEPWEVRHVEL